MRPAVKASKPAPPAWQYVPVASPCVPLLAPSRPALAHGGAARGEGAPRTMWTPPPRLGPAQSPHHEPAGCRQSRATRVRTQDFNPPQLLAPACVPGLREGHMHPNRAPIPGAHFKSHVYAACADGAGLGKEAGGERAALQYATRRQAGRQLDGCEGCAAAPHHPHADATRVLRAHATHPHEPHGCLASRGATN